MDHLLTEQFMPCPALLHANNGSTHASVQSICVAMCDRGLCHHLEYERVYLPLREVADTPLHIQGDDV